VTVGGPTAVANAAATPAARPPAVMSTVGGSRLGLSGVQSDPLPGAPALPAGLSALSWIVSDDGTGQVLAARNAHWRLPPASTLKTLFADTVLPRLPATETHRVTDADLAGMGQGSSQVGVVSGQTYTVSALWLGVFLRSGNDAVHVLAAMNGGVPATVPQMQAEAGAPGPEDPRVVTPDGLGRPTKARPSIQRRAGSAGLGGPGEGPLWSVWAGSPPRGFRPSPVGWSISQPVAGRGSRASRTFRRP